MNEEWRNELVTKGAVVDALKDNTFRLTLAEEQRCEGHVVWDEDVVFADVLEKALLALPSAQPENIARDIATIIENEKDMRVVLKNAEPQHEVRFSDEDHVWIDGKQHISLRRFMEAVKDARKDAYKRGKSKGIKKGLAMAQRWIPFSQHKPKTGQQILACSDDGVMWMTAFHPFNNFTGAWMPLPPSYKGDEDERD